MPLQFEIIDKSESPPGGWRWTQPESGREFYHYAHQPFLDQIRDHRLANGYPITADWKEELDDQLCRDNPDWFPKTCRRIGVKSGPRRLSFAAAMSFLQMLGRWASSGAPYIDQEVAEERAAICSTCPHNVPSAFSCGNCETKIQQIISIIGGKRSTRSDDKLFSCGVCSCQLKSAVHFPIESQRENLTPEMVEEFKAIDYCWKGKDL